MYKPNSCVNIHFFHQSIERFLVQTMYCATKQVLTHFKGVKLDLCLFWSQWDEWRSEQQKKL